MTKQQMWDLLEIHNLLCDTDKAKNLEAVNLLTEFIEENIMKEEA